MPSAVHALKRAHLRVVEGMSLPVDTARALNALRMEN
jgi:hypothetical protein